MLIVLNDNALCDILIALAIKRWHEIFCCILKLAVSRQLPRKMMLEQTLLSLPNLSNCLLYNRSYIVKYIDIHTNTKRAYVLIRLVRTSFQDWTRLLKLLKVLSFCLF